MPVLKGKGAREEMQNSFHPLSHNNADRGYQHMKRHGVSVYASWCAACTGLRQSPVRMLAYSQNKQASLQAI
jgi:hypothetical protein